MTEKKTRKTAKKRSRPLKLPEPATETPSASRDSSVDTDIAGRAIDAENSDLTFEQIMSLKQPHRIPVQISLDPSLAPKLEDAQRAVRAAGARARLATPNQKLADEELLHAEEQLKAIEAQVARNSVTFVFRSVNRKVIEKALEEYPPTPQQRVRFRQQLKDLGEPTNQVLPYNEETFPPVLISLSCESPEMTEEQARQMWNDDNWSRAELGRLMAAAWAANEVVL